MTKHLRAIGVVLPQFHEIEENSKWWGKGFTEWTNTEKAIPLFNGHHQPHKPHSDIGYYDLSNAESIEKQARLAVEYGLFGLCYYHYWFNGKMLLEAPVQNLLGCPTIDIPFMLCWANENWTRAWDGGEKEILIEQRYSLNDDEAHMSMLCEKYFTDKRYIKIDNRPVFSIYRHQLFPELSRTVELWNKICQRHGFDGIYLIAVENQFERPVDPKTIGFNAAMQFPFDFNALKRRAQVNLFKKLLYRFSGKRYIGKNIVPYYKMVEHYKEIETPGYLRYLSVTPGWDNSARRKQLHRSFILHNSTPQLYKDLLEHTCHQFSPPTAQENFVFLNAMNEWAEGNHLEPCKKWGYEYLKVTKQVLQLYR